MEISGCEIQSQIPLDKNGKIFYLINNVKKHPARFTQKTRKVGGVNHTNYLIIPYTKNTTSYEDQGFYQCGITINGPLSQTILSKTTDVQFSGLHSFRLYSVSSFIIMIKCQNATSSVKYIKQYKYFNSIVIRVISYKSQLRYLLYLFQSSQM